MLLLPGCATTGSMPADPATISTGIAERAGVDARGWPERPAQGLPPDVHFEDGVSVEEAVATALWNNPAFQVTLADLGFARADLIEARMLRNPILSLLFPVGPKQFEATLSWPVDTLIHRPRRVKAATLDYQVVATRLVADGLGLVASVKRAYMTTAAAERRALLARENAAVATGIRGIADARFRAGDISDMEARVTRAETLIAEATARTYEHDRDLAHIRLRELIGAPREAQLKLTPLSELALQPCGDVDALTKDALAARPDVRAAELAIEAAGARAGLARAQVWTLTATLDANGAGKQGFEAGPGLAGELPLLSRNQGNRARAAALLEQASRRYAAVRARVSEELSIAVARLAKAREVVALWEGDIVESLDTERRQAERAYEAGELPLLSVLDTSRRLVSVRISGLEARADLLDAAVSLDQAVGRSCMVK